MQDASKPPRPPNLSATPSGGGGSTVPTGNSGHTDAPLKMGSTGPAIPTQEEVLQEVARQMPLVLVKGGATAGGAKAAASHTGSLSSDDRTFDGACRQAGVTRAANVEAFSS